MFEGPPPATFIPRWAEGPLRFAPWRENAGDGGSPDETMPAQEISLWDAGYAAGRTEALAEWEAEAAQTDRLGAALARLQPMPPAELAEALATQVRALLRQLVGSASVDETLLIARCATLAELVNASPAARLHVHPEDVALLTGHEHGLTTIADPDLPRGELRLVDGATEIAAGPQTMLDNWGDDPC
jgi:flagellar biosynthesis/type III secretory pathway protein FliH